MLASQQAKVVQNDNALGSNRNELKFIPTMRLNYCLKQINVHDFLHFMDKVRDINN